MLSPDIFQYLQERLQEVQTANDDIPVIFLEVVLSLLQDAQHASISTVVARHLADRQQVIDALELLEATSGDEAFYRTLEEHQHTLLSNLALVFLTGMYYDALDIENNEVAAGLLKQHIDLIRDARISSVFVAWERALAENQRVIDALDLLEQQVTHEKFYNVLQGKREILITEKAAWFLQSHALELHQQGDSMADHYEAHAFLIKDAYTRNLTDAWEDFASVDLVVQAIQATDEPEEILKIMQKHEKALRSEAALFVLRSYIARAKANGTQDSVHYFERWFHLLEDARDSGITAAWNKFYNNLVVQIYGQLSSTATQSTSDYTSALSHLMPGTLEWADIVSNRGFAYFSSVMAMHGDGRNLELAIADFSAALPVYRKYGKQNQYAETLESLGTAHFLHLFLNQGQQVDLQYAVDDLMIVLVGTREDTYTPFHDPLQYRQQTIDNFTEALALYKKQGRQDARVRTLLKRAAIYQAGNTGSAEDILHAIDDYSAALAVIKKETTPFEWMSAIGNRGACYLRVMGDGYEERLKTRTILDLIETDTTKHMPIKLERSLSMLGELGLDNVAQALEQSGAHKVRFIPFGLLGLFPFPALQIRSMHGNKRHLGDLFEVTIAPSARAIEVAEKRAANLDRATHPYLLLGGNPYPRPPDVRELFYAQAEADTVQKIAQRFGYGEKNIHYLPSEEVTKGKVIEVLKHTWYAHLAVHGFYQPNDPRRSYLLLAGKKNFREQRRILSGDALADKKNFREEYCIFLSEALERKTADGHDTLNLEGVRLLVLSACETAIIDVRQVPDEVVGLAAGFLQAGAAGIIASLWAVDDVATYLLMSSFAQLYLDPHSNLSPARALTQAQHWLREEAANKVLMTYDPVEETTTDKTITQAQEGKGIPTKNEVKFTGLRNLHYGYKTGLSEIHAEATVRALHEPDALPYANAVYWAAFVVTGC